MIIALQCTEADDADATLLNERLDADLHEFVSDWSDLTGIATLSVAAAVLENIALELGSDAPDATAAFLRAIADMIDGYGPQADIDTLYSAMAEANRAMQEAVVAAQAKQKAVMQ